MWRGRWLITGPLSLTSPTVWPLAGLQQLTDNSPAMHPKVFLHQIPFLQHPPYFWAQEPAQNILVCIPWGHSKNLLKRSFITFWLSCWQRDRQTDKPTNWDNNMTSLANATYLLAASWIWCEACSTRSDENCSSNILTASEVPNGLSGSMTLLINTLMMLSGFSWSGDGGPPISLSPSSRSNEMAKHGISTYCKICNQHYGNIIQGCQPCEAKNREILWSKNWEK